MKRRLSALGAVLTLAVLCGAVHAAVTDESIAAAAKEYQRLFTQAREAGERPGMADMGDYLDKAFANIPVDQLTLPQINLIATSVPIKLSTTLKAKIRDSLQKIEQQPDAQGARAELLDIQLLPVTAKKPELAAAVDKVLSHPGIRDAVAGGAGASIFENLGNLDAAQLIALHDKVLALKDSISSKGSMPFFVNAAQYSMEIPNVLSPAQLATFEPLREKLSAALAEKMKGNVTDEERPRLERALDQLNGAWARGQLLEHAAPDIQFVWFQDPSDPKHTIKSLADLKGKVVVLDFWATWCGPCIASFPKVKALAHYYRGYDVVVLGVTSIQGFVNTAGGRVDTKGDEAKEIALTAQFLKDKGVTWDIGISKQNVFNPDYGVMGIPDAFIIDAKGIVKYAGVYPGEPLEKETPLIDKTLADDGLIIPASLVEMKPPTPTKAQ
jgi:thiol-disulfide isomerase/thioredoxin